jgi:hypothetical protein
MRRGKENVTLSRSHLMKNWSGPAFGFPFETLDYTENFASAQITSGVSQLQCLFCACGDNAIKRSSDENVSGTLTFQEKIYRR